MVVQEGPVLGWLEVAAMLRMSLNKCSPHAALQMYVVKLLEMKSALVVALDTRFKSCASDATCSTATWNQDPIHLSVKQSSISSKAVPFKNAKCIPRYTLPHIII